MFSEQLNKQINKCSHVVQHLLISEYRELFPGKSFSDIGKSSISRYRELISVSYDIFQKNVHHHVPKNLANKTKTNQEKQLEL